MKTWGARNAALAAGTSLILAAHASASTSAGAFLKIPVEARALSLGAGYLAQASGAGSASLNPAGLNLLTGKEASFLYAPHLEGTALGFAAYAQRTSAGTFGASLLALRSGALDGRDAAGGRLGNFTAEDKAVAVSYARNIGPLGLGINLKHISSRISSFGASTLALDAGSQAAFKLGGKQAAVGLALRNLGPGLSFGGPRDSLPLSLGMGLSFELSEMLRLNGGLVRIVNEDRTEASLGLEASMLKGVLLSGSYGLGGGSSQGAKRLPNLAGGLGFRLSNFQLDYAFMPMGELGSTQRLSLTIRLGSR